MRSNLRRISLAGLAAASLLLGLAPLAQAGEIVVKKRMSGAQGKQAIEDYWTPERMARARPLELVRDDDGEPSLRLGAKDPFNHPVVFESGAVENPSVAPNTVNGKVFGKIPGVGPYECSATSVDAANRGTIITAGHCVAEPANHEIATKLAFVPSYERNIRPFGTWVFRKIVVLKSWKKNSNFNYDFSAIAMSAQNGVNLEDAAGGATVATKLPVDQVYDSVGYPTNKRNGQVMWHCLGGYEGRDPLPIPNGPTPIAMGCDMGEGASGGGWFVDGHLNSVTSFGYVDHPKVGYGPYFGNKAAQVYAEASSK